jgi:hypothetical protein
MRDRCPGTPQDIDIRGRYLDRMHGEKIRAED